MTRAELVAVVEGVLASRRADAVALVEQFLDALQHGVQHDGRASLCRFGVFERVQKAAKPARDVHRGEPVVLPARVGVRFRAAPALKKRLAKPPLSRPE